MNITDLDFYVTLVHYPIKNKTGEIIATAVTNMDVHDIARLAITFGFKGYYIVTPIKEQQLLVQRIIDHWRGDYGKLRNNNRSEALDIIKVVSTVEDAAKDAEKNSKKKVKLIATSARKFDRAITINDFVKTGLDKNNSYMYLFGTGWGMTDDVMSGADHIFEPLSYETDYNHLAVRSAVSIIMDRLYNGIRELT
ncbi:MAG: RNA methyltransferase [Pseudomonadota bacterium]